ncbi:hypothetical protein R6Z07F_002821 [Ovis aries]
MARVFSDPLLRGGAPRGPREEGGDTDTASRPAGLLFSCHGFEITPFLPIEFCTTCFPVLPNECHGLGQTVFGNAADEDDELMMEVTVVTSQKSPEPAPQSPHKQPFVTASRLASFTRGWPCPKPLSRELLPEGSKRVQQGRVQLCQKGNEQSLLRKSTPRKEMIYKAYLLWEYREAQAKERRHHRMSEVLQAQRFTTTWFHLLIAVSSSRDACPARSATAGRTSSLGTLKAQDPTE